MKILEAARFFGLPAQNTEFDKFLTGAGIADRPVYDNETPVEFLSNDDEGFSFEFIDASIYEEFTGPVREKGDLIFHKIEVSSEKYTGRLAGYVGELPLGIKFQTTLQEAIAILGPPSRSQSAGRGRRSHTWDNANGYAISLFYQADGSEIYLLQIENILKDLPK